MSDDFTESGNEKETSIIFSVVVDPLISKRVWIMKLTPAGAKFNRQDFPNLTEDEFAEKIIHILELDFNIKFKLRSESYEEFIERCQ